MNVVADKELRRQLEVTNKQIEELTEINTRISAAINSLRKTHDHTITPFAYMGRINNAIAELVGIRNDVIKEYSQANKHWQELLGYEIEDLPF